MKFFIQWRNVRLLFVFRQLESILPGYQQQLNSNSLGNSK